MLPSDINVKIRSGTAGYNNKILVSDGKFILGKNEKVNALVLKPVISMPKVKSIFSHKTVAQQTHAHELSLTHTQKPTITHEDEKVALVLSLAGGFAIWYAFR